MPVNTASPDRPANSFTPRLVAVVIAWGAKFSEHPLLVKDRERNRGQSLLAKTLINRVRDLAEDLKVHRVPNADHVVVALLIEPMQNRELHGIKQLKTRFTHSHAVTREYGRIQW